LQQKRYLTENPVCHHPDLLQTRRLVQDAAYAVGFGGIYLNMAGREAKGIVSKDEAPRLKREIIEKTKTSSRSAAPRFTISEVYDRDQATKVRTDEAPDLVVGFAPAIASHGRP